MATVLTRFALALALVFALAACSQPVVVPPALSEVAANTASLSSFVALVEELGIDLDAATESGVFTVFAPSNALVEKYAAAWGFADAAALLAALETLTADQTKMVVYFVQSHIVSAFPSTMTGDFLTDSITGSEWYWYTYPEFAAGERLFTHVWNLYDLATDTDTLELYFYGEVAFSNVTVSLTDVSFVVTDVAIENGIVHVIDGTVDFSNLF